MKKHLIYAIIILFSASCQTLKGKYCNSFNGGFDSSCIEFLENQRFNYKTTDDLGTYSKGSGIYSLKNKKLILRFDQDSVIPRSKINIKDIAGDFDHLVSFECKLLDNQKQPLPGVRVIISNDSLREYYTNLKGELKIDSIQKGQKPLTINVKNLMGYETLKFGVVPNSHKDIFAILYPQQPRVISNQIHQYQVISRNRKRLHLENSYGQKRKFLKE